MVIMHMVNKVSCSQCAGTSNHRAGLPRAVSLRNSPACCAELAWPGTLVTASAPAAPLWQPRGAGARLRYAVAVSSNGSDACCMALASTGAPRCAAASALAAACSARRASDVVITSTNCRAAQQRRQGTQKPGVSSVHARA